jgi:hypothetical protein
MSVHEIKRESLLDIGAGLRKLADWADQNPEAVRTVIVVSAASDRVVSCHGYGERCSAVEALGWLALAQQRVLGSREAPATDLGPAA